MGGHDDVQYLAASPVRSRILEVLREEPLRPTEITEQIDATRTTVQRILAGFLERDWVVKRGRCYAVTVTGRGIHAAYRNLLDDVTHAAELGPFAAHVGAVADDLPWDALSEATVTTATTRNPLAPGERLVEILRSAETDHMRVVTPIVAEMFNDAAGRFLERGGSVELTIDRGVLLASQNEYPGALDQARENPDVDLEVYPDSLGFGLILYEEQTLIGAYDEYNNVKAVLESEDPALYEWATDTYERYRSAALTPAEALEVIQPAGTE